MTEEEKNHLKMIEEYGLGLKIVKAGLVHTDKILTDLLSVTKDAEEKSKAQFIQERVRQCLVQLTK
ncbi:MAG: hypothetical protein NTX59_02590 [Elusimicrobia bacterium]|nr:hypothetical protein [Elusimicrobiota bacterium]